MSSNANKILKLVGEEGLTQYSEGYRRGVEAYKAELRERIKKYFDREIEIYSSPQMQQMYYAISPVKRLMTYKKDILNIIKGEK